MREGELLLESTPHISPPVGGDYGHPQYIGKLPGRDRRGAGEDHRGCYRGGIQELGAAL